MNPPAEIGNWRGLPWLRLLAVIGSLAVVLGVSLFSVSRAYQSGLAYAHSLQMLSRIQWDLGQAESHWTPAGEVPAAANQRHLARHLDNALHSILVMAAPGQVSTHFNSPLGGEESRPVHPFFLSDPRLLQRLSTLRRKLEMLRSHLSRADSEPGAARMRSPQPFLELWGEFGQLQQDVHRLALRDRQNLLALRIFLVVFCSSLAVLVCLLWWRGRVDQADLEAELDQMVEETRCLSVSDATTGLVNDTRFRELAEQMWKLAARQKQSVTLVLIDIDRFRSFNDYFGFSSGDACLKQIGQAIDSICKRPGDVVARLSGGRLAVLLFNSVNPLPLIERMHQTVQALDIAGVPSYAAHRVTVSIGFSSALPGPRGQVSELIGLAEQAVERAKNAGGDRIEKLEVGIAFNQQGVIHGR